MKARPIEVLLVGSAPITLVATLVAAGFQIIPIATPSERIPVLHVAPK